MDGIILDKKPTPTRVITTVAFMSALSYVLYVFVKFPLPALFPAFLDFQVSDLPALLTGFMIGPRAAVAVLLIKILTKLPLSGTLYVGEFADLLIGLAFILPSSLIYKRRRTKGGAVAALAVGIAASTAVALVANYAVLIPFYVRFFFKGDWNILLNAVRPLYKGITRDSFFRYYLLLAALPFNLLRGILTALLTFFLYKGLARAFNMLDGQKTLFNSTKNAGGEPGAKEERAEFVIKEKTIKK
ncbi:MAG: ECF transporter S component [Clostridiales bacterium]|jgi:riboflavin transporter FmnP|nr:ECF transporter S component [Clostridiales bacterium]